LSSLLSGKADLSGEMALRLEKAFGVKMDTLMRMQVSYDIAQNPQARETRPCTADCTHRSSLSEWGNERITWVTEGTEKV